LRLRGHYAECSCLLISERKICPRALSPSHSHLFSGCNSPIPELPTTMADKIPKPRRQRAILSCNDCRRRKLRCDRLDPCNRCIKGGIADSCAYGPGAHGTPSEERRGHSAKRIRKIIGRRQTSNVAESLHESGSEVSVLESTEPISSRGTYKQADDRQSTELPNLPQTPVAEPRDQVEFLAKSPDLKGVSYSSAAVGMLSGRTYGTQFHGASSVWSVVAHVSEGSRWLVLLSILWLNPGLRRNRFDANISGNMTDGNSSLTFERT